MLLPTTEIDPALLAALPPEGEPMMFEQCDMAVVLTRSLGHHRDRSRLLWHVTSGEAVDYLDEPSRPRRVFPDVHVVLDTPQLPPGRSFRTWIHLRAPDFVVEFGSEDTIDRDRSDKRALYQRLGVAEYFVFDVDQLRIPGLLEGYRLGPDGAYQPIAPVASPLGGVRLRSERLGLELEAVPTPELPHGRYLRAFLPGAAEPLPTAQEAAHAEELARQAAALAEKEAALAEALARLEQLERGRRGDPPR